MRIWRTKILYMACTVSISSETNISVFFILVELDGHNEEGKEDVLGMIYNFVRMF